jgi:uncharacterized protein
MSIKDQLVRDMKQAMRDRDSARLSVIRFLIAEVKNIEIDQGELDDAGVQKVIARQIKQIKDAVVDYQNAGRDERVAEEQQKVSLLESYLPAQLTDEELVAVVKATVAANPGKKQGEIIREVMAQTAGQADGGRVARLVQTELIA